MDPASYRIAWHCSRCGTLFEQQVGACSRCGNADIRPFYDYYRVLGVGEGADERTLKAAYKKLSLQYHPDVNPQGKDRFLLISEAFQVLKDPRQQQAYLARREAALRGDYTEAAPRGEPAYGYGPRGEADDFGFTWTWQTPNQEEYERMFREFHRIQRMSVISSRLGAILGAVLGGVFASWSLAAIIPGLLLGFIIGRLNPGWAPGLIRLSNFLMALVLAAGAFLFFRYKVFIALPLLLLAAWLFFATTRRWARELGRP